MKQKHQTPKEITGKQSSGQRTLSRSAKPSSFQHVNAFDEGLHRWFIDHKALIHVATSTSKQLKNIFSILQDYYQGDSNYQRGAAPPSSYRHSQMDLTEWDENQSHNGNVNNQNGHSREQTMRRSMMSNGGSQDRYPDERREIYQYRNGNVSREDFGEEMSDRRREGRRDNSVISNAVLNHLAGLHRRPVNRVRSKDKSPIRYHLILFSF